MKTHLFKLLLTIGAAAVMSVTAQTTNVIFGTDFDGDGNLTGQYGYTYAGGNLGGAASGFTGGITAGVGVTNSSAFDAMPDFTLTGSDANYIDSSAYTYSGTDIHLSFGAPINPLTPTANAGALVLSFDAMIQGLEPGANSTTLYFDNNFSILTNGVPAIQFGGGSFTVSSNWVHFAVPLSELTLISGSLNDLTNSAELATVSGLTVDFRDTDETGTLLVDRSPIWGFTHDGQLIIDNFYLSETTASTPTPLQEKLIWEVNFKDKQAANPYVTTNATYGFVFRDGANAATTTVVTNPVAGVGGSPALVVTADLSSWAANPPAAFSGFGAGVAHTVPYTLSNTSKSAYRVYWTAATGGLLSGITSASGNASIEFLVPPGTLTPSNDMPAVVLELAPSITLSSNFTSFVFDGSTSPIGLYNGGSQAMFNQYISQVTLIKVAAQFNGTPDIGTLFGYDADNTMTVNNVKVVELVPATPPVMVAITNNQIKLFWTDPGTGGTAQLQSSTNLNGPFLDVAGEASGAASPYTVPAGNARMFFRTRWVP